MVVKELTVDEIQCMIDLCTTKKWTDFVRILDQHEVSGAMLGELCSLQIMDYMTGAWVDVGVINSLSYWYLVVREDLGYDGAIRLAVAGE